MRNKFSSTKSRKFNKKISRKTFTRKDYMSGDGMLTTVWGPAAWHLLHTISFNYPTNPTHENKKQYKEYVESLKNVLPCKYCRMNLENNLKTHPLQMCHMKNRETFSKYIYNLHEIVNKMLGKKSGLSYCDVRERYEHFRSRCTQNDGKKIFKFGKTRKNNKEKGCTEPLYGKKAKCVIQIVPQEERTPSFVVDNQCIKVKTDRMDRMDRIDGSGKTR
uniref:thiol oxidase n=1 Tax=viral metagenome TaxID=1070528 RepID=A0A6C0EVV0_9ZZZZ